MGPCRHLGDDMGLKGRPGLKPAKPASKGGIAFEGNRLGAAKEAVAPDAEGEIGGGQRRPSNIGLI